MEHLIALQDVYKIYPSGEGEVYALDGISLSIDQAEFTAIVGTSGSGKSTLMNILGCLDFPTKGSYRLDGEEITGMTDRQLSVIRNSTIGFIFQSFNLIPSLTALENVELQLIYGQLERRKRRELAIQALQQVGLGHRMNHKPSQLSGGQQQRVAIARAIAASPPMILADEPTGNLDSASAKEIMAILKELNRSGKTVVLITHDSEIADQANRRIHISDGRLVG